MQGLREHALLDELQQSTGLRALGNLGQIMAADAPSHGLPASASLLLPPLATVFLQATEN